MVLVVATCFPLKSIAPSFTRNTHIYIAIRAHSSCALLLQGEEAMRNRPPTAFLFSLSLFKYDLDKTFQLLRRYHKSWTSNTSFNLYTKRSQMTTVSSFCVATYCVAIHFKFSHSTFFTFSKTYFNQTQLDYLYLYLYTQCFFWPWLVFVMDLLQQFWTKTIQLFRIV